MATVYASEDTYSLSDAANDTHGNSSDLAIIDNSTHTAHTYIKFDLSAWSGKTLDPDDGGLIKLYVSSNEIAIGQYTNIRFRRITETWSESTLTWNNSPSTTSTNEKNKHIYESSGEGWLQYNITDLLQDILDDGDNCCGVYVEIDNYVVWFESTENTNEPKLILTEQSIDDYYVKTNGDDAKDGRSWANAWKTINKAATTVADGKTVHIGFGDYTAEPSGNKIAPQNVGTSGITYVPETADTGGGTGTVSIEQNA